MTDSDLEYASALLDQYMIARRNRLEEQRKVNGMEETEKALKAELIGLLEQHNTTAVGGKEGTGTLVTKDKPSVTDWDRVHSYIVATNEWDLVYRRVNEKAVKERWDQGVEVPGVTKYPVTELSIRSAKK